MTGGPPRSSDRGQAMVEFALVAPILFLLIFGIIEAGLAFGKSLDLQSGTRDAARKATVSIYATDPVAEVEAALYAAVSLTDDDDLTWTVTPAPPWEHGDIITVTASTQHGFNIMGDMGAVWDGTLRAEAEVRVE